jgi:hypothetical protein
LPASEERGEESRETIGRQPLAGPRADRRGYAVRYEAKTNGRSGGGTESGQERRPAGANGATTGQAMEGDT